MQLFLFQKNPFCNKEKIKGLFSTLTNLVQLKWHNFKLGTQKTGQKCGNWACGEHAFDQRKAVSLDISRGIKYK